MVHEMFDNGILCKCNKWTDLTVEDNFGVQSNEKFLTHSEECEGRDAVKKLLSMALVDIEPTKEFISKQGENK